jgi:putative DNA primase/helicase
MSADDLGVSLLEDIRTHGLRAFSEEINCQRFQGIHRQQDQFWFARVTNALRAIPNATNEQISAIIEGVQRGTLGKIEFSDLPGDGNASQANGNSGVDQCADINPPQENGHGVAAEPPADEFPEWEAEREPPPESEIPSDGLTEKQWVTLRIALESAGRVVNSATPENREKVFGLQTRGIVDTAKKLGVAIEAALRAWRDELFSGFAGGQESLAIAEFGEAAIDDAIGLAIDQAAEPAQPLKPAHGLQCVRLDKVESEHVNWLWPKRLPCGSFVLFTGLPDCGKTLVATDIAARITCGDMWPDGSGRAPLGSIIVLSSEDHLRNTTKPRFEAADADTSRVYSLEFALIDGKSNLFSLQRDLERLEALISEIGDVRMVLIDPITAYLGAGKIDSYKATDVRSILTPLVALGERANVLNLGITHPPKHASSAINAVGASMAFVAQARVAWLFSYEEENQQTLMTAIKNNLVSREDRTGLSYRIASKVLTKEIVAPYVCWDSAPVTRTADEILAAREARLMEARRATKEPTARDEAVEFLKDKLAYGPVEAEKMFEAADDDGIARITLKRAKKKLGVVSKQVDFGGPHYWSLPTGDHLPPTGDHS